MKVMLPSGKEYKVINMMADGTICDDLTKYMDTHELPEDVVRMAAYFMQRGRAMREESGG